MNEPRWSEEGAPPPKKKGIPTWAWWVGGGCLFLLLAGAVLTLLAVSFVKSSLDAEKQWPEVAKILPYDQRPEGVKLSWGSQIGMDVFVFIEPHGYVAVLMRPPAGDDNSRKKMFDENQTFSTFDQRGRHEMKPGTIRVQGRELRALRFVQEAGGGGGVGKPNTGAGGSILVDLAPEDSARPVIFQLTRIDGRDDPIPDEAVTDFLKPFHVGPDR